MGQDDPMIQETDGVAEAIAGERKRGSFRLAAYAVCIEDGRVLLAHHASKTGLFRAVGSSTRRIHSMR